METYTVSDPIDYGMHQYYAIKSLTHPGAFCECVRDVGGKTAAYHINSENLHSADPEARLELIHCAVDVAYKEYPDVSILATLTTDWETRPLETLYDLVAYYMAGFLPVGGDALGKRIELRYNEETTRPF